MRIGLHCRTGTGICDSGPGLQGTPSSVRPGLRGTSSSVRLFRVCGPAPGLRLGPLVGVSPLAVTASRDSVPSSTTFGHHPTVLG
jgi:hypothetical protein